MTKSLTYRPPDRIHTKQPSRAAARPKFDRLIQQNDNKVINYKLSDNNNESSMRGQNEALNKFKREKFIVRDSPVKGENNVENDY